MTIKAAFDWFDYWGLRVIAIAGYAATVLLTQAYSAWSALHGDFVGSLKALGLSCFVGLVGLLSLAFFDVSGRIFGKQRGVIFFKSRESV